MKEVNEELQENQESHHLYTPADMAQKLGITTMLLNKWVQHFEIETEWTKENKQGHRRYTDDNLKVLTNIKEKVQDNNWSWDKTKAWLNGDETVNQQVKTGVEAKLDKLLESDARNEQFQLAITQRFDEIMKEIKNLKDENVKLKGYIDTKLTERLLIEERDRELITSITTSIKARQQLAAAALDIEEPAESEVDKRDKRQQTYNQNENEIEKQSIFAKWFGIGKKKRG